MASIKDVAKASGVSTATVSRIINDNPAISPETREKVLRVMKQLDYVPNSMARSLSHQKSFTVALMVDIEDSKSFNNPFFYEVMHGIEAVVYGKGFCLIIANQKTSFRKGKVLDWLIQGKRAQGMILPSSIVTPGMVRELKRIQFPFVVLGEPTDTSIPIDWADIDNHQGGGQATEHLLAKGYERIAFIGENQTEIFSRNRISGYKDALQRHGIPFRPEYLKEGGTTKADGIERMAQLLKLAERPDAVICSNNFLSLGAMKAAVTAGIRIPEDLGLVSFDNWPVADLVEPSLTTVDIDVYELGAHAARMLFQAMENPSARPQHILISTGIEERQSTKRPHVVAAT